MKAALALIISSLEELRFSGNINLITLDNKFTHLSTTKETVDIIITDTIKI